METSAVDSKVIGKTEEQGLLFEYALKFLLVAAFLELLLYRLVSRLGMHLSKIMEKFEAVRIAFQGLSWTGLLLLNLTSILGFLVISLLLFQKMRKTLWSGPYDAILIPSISLLLMVTIANMIFPPAILGNVISSLLTFLVIGMLVMEYMRTNRLWMQRLTIGCFFLGISSWTYYKTMSMGFAFLQMRSAPPLVHEINRFGEAMMVLASILVFWAYGSTPLWTKNKQQRRWGLTLLLSGGLVFFLLLFLDYIVSLYSPAVALDVRKAGEGIGWIFQMGMGYTFYLPFAFYVLGLICWSYTVIKLVTIGRLAGYGLGLMFMAGYSFLQISHLVFMVVLGLMLLNIDKRGTLGKLRGKLKEKVVYQPIEPAFGPTR